MRLRWHYIIPLILVFTAEPAFCQEDSVFYKRYQKDNTIALDKAIYKSDIQDVNKKIIVETTRLTPTGWVNDFEQLLSPEQFHALDSMITTFEKETTVEIAIVTIDSGYIKKGKFDSLILDLARVWAVGKKDINNGILIGISSSLRKIRITNGEGITEILSDKETKRIIDEVMIPEFRKNNYYKGLENGLHAIFDKFKTRDK